MSIVRRLPGILLALVAANMLAACGGAFDDDRQLDLQVREDGGIKAFSATAKRESGGSSPTCLGVMNADGKVIMGKCGDGPGNEQTTWAGTGAAAMGAVGMTAKGYFGYLGAKHYGRGGGTQFFVEGGDAAAGAENSTEVDVGVESTVGGDGKYRRHGGQGRNSSKAFSLGR